MSAGRPLLEDVAALAFPRFPGTDGERRAADFVEERFRSCGLETVREPFRASPTAVRRLRLVAHGTVAAGAWILALLGPDQPASVLLGLALLAALPLFSRWRPAIERAFDAQPQIESANVIGRRPGGGSTVVLMAHVDSKSAALPTFVPVVIILAAVVAIVVATAIALLRVAGLEVPAGPPALLFVTAAGLLLVPFIPVGNRSPGAMDNASGVAVLLELARTLPGDADLAGVDLVFLATGAEEIGLCGSMRWAQAHAADLNRDRTVVINLDSVGVGRQLLAVDVHGKAGGRPMGPLCAVSRSSRASGWIPCPGRPAASRPSRCWGTYWEALPAASIPRVILSTT